MHTQTQKKKKPLMHMQHFAYVSNNSSSCFAAPSNPAPFRPFYNLLYLHFFFFSSSSFFFFFSAVCKVLFWRNFCCLSSLPLPIFAYLCLCSFEPSPLATPLPPQPPHTHTTHILACMCVFIYILENWKIVFPFASF